MGKHKKTVAFVAANNLCMGCGICSDACPNGAISIQRVGDLNKPVIDKSKCKNSQGCNRCFTVCAGHGWNIHERNVNLFSESDSRDNSCFGKYQKCFVGHSKDYEIRYHSASGGCCTTFLIYLLKKGFIKGAVVTGFSEKDPLKAEPFIATSVEEILSAKSSKYCPVTMAGIITAVKKFNQPVAVVGTPCHIQAFRKYASVDKRFADLVYAYIGIFCSSTKDYSAINSILKKYGIDRSQIKKFAYRDEGCLGSMKIEFNDGSPVFKADYGDYYMPLRSFHKPERCVSCIDHYAMLADISFGDIHIPPYLDDKIGSNSILVRSKKILNILNQAYLDDYIYLDEITDDEIVRSQRILPYRRSIFWGHRFIEKILFRPVVQYDKYPQKGNFIKSILFDLKYRCQRAMRKCR